MKIYILSPESPGRLGPLCGVRDGTDPAELWKIRVIISRYRCDPLIRISSHYLVTSALAESLTAAGITGFELLDATLEATQPEWELPEFKWLMLRPEVPEPDLFLTADHRLGASERALDVVLRARPRALRHDNICVLNAREYHRANMAFWISAALAAGGMWAFLEHAFHHFCMCGHLAHEVTLRAKMVDSSILSFYSASLIATLWIPAPKVSFYLCFVLVLFLSPEIFPYLVFLLPLCFRDLKRTFRGPGFIPNHAAVVQRLPV